jgi:branched-chain amino acid transport system substrate-binding protein
MHTNRRNVTVPRPSWRSSAAALAAVGLALVGAACGSSSGSSSSSSGGGATQAAVQVPQQVTPWPSVASLTSCGSKPVKVASVGMMAALTGGLGADEQQGVDGAKLAIRDINAAGGICGSTARYKLGLVVGNTQDESASAVVTAARLLMTTPNLNFAIAGASSGTEFEETLFARAKMPYIVHANAASTQKIIGKDPSAYPTVWSRVPSYAAYGTAMPPLLNKWTAAGDIHLPYGKTVYIVGSNDSYGAGIASELTNTFKSVGWRVTGTATVAFQQTQNWQGLLAKIRSAPSSVIVVTDSTPPDDAAFVNQFGQSPTKSLIFEQYAPSVPQFLQLAGSNANGVLYNNLGAVIPTAPGTAQETAEFQNTYHQIAGYFPDITYSDIVIYGYCVHKVGDPTNRLAIGACIGSLNMATPAGILKFDQQTHVALEGDNYEPIQFYQIQNGKQTLIYPPQYAKGNHVTEPPYIH